MAARMDEWIDLFVKPDVAGELGCKGKEAYRSGHMP